MGDIAVSHAYSAVKDGGEVRPLHVVDPLDAPNFLIGGHLENLPTPTEYAMVMRRCAEHLQGLIPVNAEARQIETNVEIIEYYDPF